ncbi:unnamed protein product [Mytilus edulis]|uniref:C2H2-type domain-containing protein n=1 Tax=Mytilus edulis TaxID=6550 RepID=A0A8S3Q9J5_MYTED|nr:unnamed protein product [Mytilus edulis]
MDRQSGKMSQKYECLHCGAVFSKRSFLEEHKRILGHRDLFSCDVCHKNFYRKDNLDTHKKKHDKINNICYQHYSEPESLELHHIHTHHGQTGRGQKRKGQENYGPPVKRKLTTFDNPEDMYTIMVVGEHRMPKFNTTSTRYKVTFKDLDIRGIPNILKSLKVLFNSIIRNITEFMDQSDLVRLSVQCPELDFPISLPFMKLSQLHTERLLSEIERVLQSYEQFVLDETLEIELIHVSLPSGGIGKRCKYVDLEKTLNEKRCFLQIQNKDDLCCARAIMTAKARLDGHEKWNSIRQGRNIQGELARKLHNKAGVPFRRCGIEEIKSFQRILDGYQIHVVSKEHFNAIIYEGPTAEKKIYLYLHDHHYDVITAMPAFLSRNYFCTKCNKGYDHKVDHSCNNVCHQCYKTHESGDEDWIYCNDCNRYFKSAKCYEMHKQETSTGKSTCYTNFRCRKCNQSVYTKLHKTAHKCGEHYCKTCKDYVPEEHKCYMLPACPDNIDTLKHDVKPGENAKQLKKKHTKTFIFFDFECTQNKVLQCDMGFEKNIEGRKCKHCKQSWCGTRQHIPNLCIAHKICELCKDSKVDKTSYCDSCGKHEHIFSGESSRDDFCRWLFTEKMPDQKYCVTTLKVMIVILSCNIFTKMLYCQR